MTTEERIVKDERAKELLKLESSALIEAVEKDDYELILRHWYRLADWWENGVREIAS